MKTYTTYFPYIQAAHNAVRDFRRRCEIPFLLGQMHEIQRLDFKQEYGFEVIVDENGAFDHFETDLTIQQLVERLKAFM